MSRSGSSFRDYHLIVDDDDDDDDDDNNEEAEAVNDVELRGASSSNNNDNDNNPNDPPPPPPPPPPPDSTGRSCPDLALSSPSVRQVLYSHNHNDNRNDVYFDEDTTLPSIRDETFLDEYDPHNYRSRGTNRHNSSLLLLQRQRQRQRRLSTPPRLGRKNYLNVVTYVAHLFVSWGIGIWGLDGTLETRWQITTRYESLVTPAAWAYHLWYPILVLEGIFAAAQVAPYYRNRPIIQDGIGYFFFYIFVLQTAWTLFFSFQFFVASFVSVVLTLVCLLSLLLSQLHTQSTNATDEEDWQTIIRQRPSALIEYVLFRFPFYLHTGWMVLMTVDHFALLFRAFSGTTPSVQVAADVISLALMLAAGVACLNRPPYQDFVIPTVLVWSFVGIADRLQNPSHNMQQAYGLVIVHAIQYAAQALAGTLVACVLPCVMVWLSRQLCIIHVVELED
eukprot:scaffold6216_cov149-Amphora_coffeaeformis.AAC.1